jgi:hypothetical protein
MTNTEEAGAAATDRRCQRRREASYSSGHRRPGRSAGCYEIDYGARGHQPQRFANHKAQDALIRGPARLSVQI